jgi:hypothetical protein
LSTKRARPLDPEDVVQSAYRSFCAADADRLVLQRSGDSSSAEFTARYRAAGARDTVTLVVAKGQGYNFWEGFFRCQELIDFAVDRARAGAVWPSRR